MIVCVSLFVLVFSFFFFQPEAALLFSPCSRGLGVVFRDSLTRADNTEYAVVRADNFGWGDCYAACTPSGGQTDWAAWLAAMDDALVTVSVVNKGDGTADVKAVMVGNDGNTYYQDYIGITPVDADDLYFRFTVEGSHLIFE